MLVSGSPSWWANFVNFALCLSTINYNMIEAFYHFLKNNWKMRVANIAHYMTTVMWCGFCYNCLELSAQTYQTSQVISLFIQLNEKSIHFAEITIRKHTLLDCWNVYGALDFQFEHFSGHRYSISTFYLDSCNHSMSECYVNYGNS